MSKMMFKIRALLTLNAHKSKKWIGLDDGLFDCFYFLVIVKKNCTKISIWTRCNTPWDVPFKEVQQCKKYKALCNNKNAVSISVSTSKLHFCCSNFYCLFVCYIHSARKLTWLWYNLSGYLIHIHTCMHLVCVGMSFFVVSAIASDGRTLHDKSDTKYKTRQNTKITRSQMQLWGEHTNKVEKWKGWRSNKFYFELWFTWIMQVCSWTHKYFTWENLRNCGI